MASAVVEETIRCRPDDFLEFVMDPVAYARVDTKIGSVDRVRRHGDVTEFRFRPTLPGVPGPAPRIVSRMTLTPGRRVDARFAPAPRNRLARRITRFSGGFAAEAVAGGTRVTRSISFEFTPLLRWLLDPPVRRRLEADVRAELRGAREYLESAGTASDRGAAERAAER